VAKRAVTSALLESEGELATASFFGPKGSTATTERVARTGDG